MLNNEVDPHRMYHKANKTTTDSSINGILDDFFRETSCFNMWDGKIKLKNCNVISPYEL